MSTSVEARASVEASGLIWLMSGQTAEAAPTAATAPVAIYRKSLRVGSTVVAVAKISSPIGSGDRRGAAAAPLRPLPAKLLTLHAMPVGPVAVRRKIKPAKAAVAMSERNGETMAEPMTSAVIWHPYVGMSIAAM